MMFNGMNGLEILNSWPRFESGELVGFGDEYVNAKGNVSTLRTIVIKDCRDRLGGGYYWKLGKGACAVVVKNGERIKRPPVRAADGKPLEVGQTVWRIDTGAEYWVKSGQTITSDAVVIIRKTDCDCESEIVKASQLTHQRPVLDADGVPIKVGDTVWRTSDAREFEVTGIDGAFAIRVRDESMDIGVWTTPCGFTHTKPEPPDSWERVEEDVENGVCDYFDSDGRCSSCPQLHVDCIKSMLADIVKRCKRLAERGE